VVADVDTAEADLLGRDRHRVVLRRADLALDLGQLDRNACHAR
jgi:hypothetical protein